MATSRVWRTKRVSRLPRTPHPRHLTLLLHLLCLNSYP